MVRIPYVGCEFQKVFWDCSFSASMNWFTSPPVMLILVGRDWVASCKKIIPVTVEQSITFSNTSFPGDIANVDDALTGFIPTLMVAMSCWNCFSVMYPD